MFDNIVQNFNPVSFALGGALTLLIVSVGKVVGDYLLLLQARQRVKKADEEYQRLAKELIGNEKKLEKIVGEYLARRGK